MKVQVVLKGTLYCELFTHGQLYRLCTCLALNITTPVEFTLAPLLHPEKQKKRLKNVNIGIICEML